MARQPLARWRDGAFRGALLVVASTAAQAQLPGSAASGSPGIGGITGVITDSAGTGIASAQVTIVGVGGRGGSDATGAYRLIGVPAGRQMLVVRRIGFRPDSSLVTVVRAASIVVDVRLAPAAERMPPVVVDGGHPVIPRRLRGFDERRRRAIGGHYFTAAEIDRRNPHLVTDLLRTLPGVRATRQNGQTVITLRGQRCPPLIWVDGTPAAAGYLDPDVLHPASLAGIEIYVGVATVPPEFLLPDGQGVCGGVIALWSKTPPPPPRETRGDEREAGAAPPLPAAAVYHATDVDRPAAVDTAFPVAPLYPDSLFRARVEGRVLMEFVVSQDGSPELGTLTPVLSTHPLFSEAARRAVADARFVPAIKGGRPVRQLVHLPLTFAISPEE